MLFVKFQTCSDIATARAARLNFGKKTWFSKSKSTGALRNRRPTILKFCQAAFLTPRMYILKYAWSEQKLCVLWTMHTYQKIQNGLKRMFLIINKILWFYRKSTKSVTNRFFLPSLTWHLFSGTLRTPRTPHIPPPPPLLPPHLPPHHRHRRRLQRQP